MEELKAKLEKIREDMKEIEKVTETMKKETSFLEYFSKIKKEV